MDIIQAVSLSVAVNATIVRLIRDNELFNILIFSLW